MEPGDRVTIVSGPDRLNEGELVGWAGDGKPRVWIPTRGVTRSYGPEQISALIDARWQREKRRQAQRQSDHRAPR